MIAKRIGAVLAAGALIVGAWLIRSGVIDEDGTTDAGDDDRPPAAAEVLVCIQELAEICRTSIAGTDLQLETTPAGETLDALIAGTRVPTLWLTFDPFPQMINEARGRAGSGAQPISHSVQELATSRIGVVAEEDAADTLRRACDPVDLGCVGGQSEVKIALSQPDSGIGILTLAAVIDAQSENSFSPDTFDLSWARGLQDNSRATLSGRTAVRTMQTRTTIQAAYGAEAEIAATQRNRFSVLYAEPMVRADVVLMVPGNVDVPSGLTESLSTALTEAGWKPPAPTEPNGVPEPGAILAIRAFWEDL